MINWINSRFGTATYVAARDLADTVVIDVRDLVDKRGNLPGAILAKISEAISYLREEKTVVICCDYGTSRSNAIAAGVVSQIEHLSPDSALQKVMNATHQWEVNAALFDTVRSALDVSATSATAAESRRKRRILVTGGTGFIGSNLVPKLRQYGEVFTPNREESGLELGAVKLSLVIREHRIDTLVHLANPRIYVTNHALGESLTMLRNILDACHSNSVRLVYLSSWEIYSGYRSSRRFASETLPPLPKGPYGEAKYLAEILIKLHEQHHGLNSVVFRLGPVYGKQGGPKFIFNFAEKARMGSPITTHVYLNGPPHLDMVYVEDAVAAICAAIEREARGFFNIGGGSCVSTLEIAQWIIRALGSKSSLSTVPLDAHAANLLMDTSRASEVLGWSPSVDVWKGLEQTVSEING